MNKISGIRNDALLKVHVVDAINLTNRQHCVQL
jgi:hypothetical protein